MIEHWPSMLKAQGSIPEHWGVGVGAQITLISHSLEQTLLFLSHINNQGTLHPLHTVGNFQLCVRRCLPF